MLSTRNGQWCKPVSSLMVHAESMAHICSEINTMNQNVAWALTLGLQPHQPCTQHIHSTDSFPFPLPLFPQTHYLILLTFHHVLPCNLCCQPMRCNCVFVQLLSNPLVETTDTHSQNKRSTKWHKEQCHYVCV